MSNIVPIGPTVEATQRYELRLARAVAAIEPAQAALVRELVDAMIEAANAGVPQRVMTAAFKAAVDEVVNALAAHAWRARELLVAATTARKN